MATGIPEFRRMRPATALKTGPLCASSQARHGFRLPSGRWYGESRAARHSARHSPRVVAVERPDLGARRGETQSPHAVERRLVPPGEGEEGALPHRLAQVRGGEVDGEVLQRRASPAGAGVGDDTAGGFRRGPMGKVQAIAAGHAGFGHHGAHPAADGRYQRASE